MTQRRKYTPSNGESTNETTDTLPAIVETDETSCEEVVEEVIEAVVEKPEPEPEPEPEPPAKEARSAYLRPTYATPLPETSRHPRNTPRYAK